MDNCCTRLRDQMRQEASTITFCSRTLTNMYRLKPSSLNLWCFSNITWYITLMSNILTTWRKAYQTPFTFMTYLTTSCTCIRSCFCNCTTLTWYLTSFTISNLISHVCSLSFYSKKRYGSWAIGHMGMFSYRGYLL